MIGTIDVCHLTSSDLFFKLSTLNWRIIRDNKRKFVADDSKTMPSKVKMKKRTGCWFSSLSTYVVGTFLSNFVMCTNRKSQFYL